MAEKSAGSFFGIETAQEKVSVCQRVKCGRAGMLSGPGFNLICQSLRCFAWTLYTSKDWLHWKKWEGYVSMQGYFQT